MRGLGLAALVALVALAVPEAAFAHGLGGITDLPVPGWLFLVGGATVLIVSFLALGVLWKEPLLEGPGHPFPRWANRVLRSRATRILFQAVSVGLFALVWAAAAFGPERVSLNLAPTFVYVVFWVGVPVLCVLLGDVWSVLDPWRGVADAVAWVGRRLGIDRSTRDYPAAFGVWPGVILLFAFIALELVYTDPANPRVLAIAILVYSLATWAGMALFGRETWTQNGDGFAVYFGYLSRIALFGTERREPRRVVVLRRPLSGLAFVDRRAGAVTFLSVMLGSVAFDGFSRSSWWQDRLYDLQGRFSSPTTADRVLPFVNLGFLVVVIAIVGIAYTVAVRAAQRQAGSGVDFRGVFLGSLIPIAFVYVLAHYLTYLLIQGQFAIPLLSDPFGKGWDLLGTTGFVPKLDVLSPNQTWYTQVAALVVGHVLGLVVAHDRAVALVSSPKLAARTQLAMLALMVFYTVGGMWLLSLT